MHLSAVAPADDSGATGKSSAHRTLVLASLAHALHDGYTDMIYVLLPVWRTEFALNYVALAVLRALYVGVLAALQIPSAQLAKYVNARTVLMLGTLLSSSGYALAGFSGGLIGLCASLALAGAGGSVQHPLAAAAVSRAYGVRARGPLGTYNFAGDLGKATLPPLISLLLAVMHWRSTLGVATGLGILVAVLIRWLMPLVPAPPPSLETVIARNHEDLGKEGFGLLFVIGLFDTAAAALPMAVAIACGSLDCLGVRAGKTVLINGAGTTVGFAAVQISLLRGAHVIATAGNTFAPRLRGLGAVVTSYGNGLPGRIAALPGSSPDLILDTAPVGGALPALVQIAGDSKRVMTISDFAAAKILGVRSNLEKSGMRIPYDVLPEFAGLAAQGRFSIPIARTFALDEWKTALSVSESQKARGKLIFLP